LNQAGAAEKRSLWFPHALKALCSGNIEEKALFLSNLAIRTFYSDMLEQQMRK
jgi:hypothetical protein